MIPHLPYGWPQSGPAGATPDASHDLQTQFEAILDAVWEAEDNWRFDDRLDMAFKIPGQASKG